MPELLPLRWQRASRFCLKKGIRTIPFLCCRNDGIEISLWFFSSAGQYFLFALFDKIKQFTNGFQKIHNNASIKIIEGKESIRVEVYNVSEESIIKVIEEFLKTKK